MSETYLLICNGKRHEGIGLDEVKRVLIDDCHYSYAKVKAMLDSVVGRNYAPVTIGWTAGRRMNWTIDGIRMGYKAAHFALVFKGHTDEEAACLLRCAKLLAEVERELEC